VTEKPLHVRVAEALGDEVHEVAGVWYTGREMDAAEARQDPFSARPVPHYDTDWSAGGPLIAKYATFADRSSHRDRGAQWAVGYRDIVLFFGDTPLEAVCKLVVALADGGRLKESA
jgi:hypothetical protein